MTLFAVHNEKQFHIGDVVRVHQKIHEDDPLRQGSSEASKVRIQIFEGMVIAIKGEGINKSFMVRRIGAGGIGVERIFPLASPLIEKIEVVKQGSVRRSKLYYLRKKSAHEIAEITRRRSGAAKQVKQSESKSKSKPKRLKTEN
ncbi:MAG: 50S ribosomal protein L19 [Candidatus Blackburnbacteria bacterium]|nr:50S ribosomal protein L19 [Candidatus Blackburnbacteria bacterium]